jgi:hypothetical protein
MIPLVEMTIYRNLMGHMVLYYMGLLILNRGHLGVRYNPCVFT